MQVSLVHEWLTNLAGSEQVVAALRRTFPGSSVSTTLFWAPEFPGWEPVHTSALQPLVRGPGSHQRLGPLLPPAWRTVEVPEADVVVTSFHTFALRARLPDGVPHVVYCHTPPRFLWEPQQLAGERVPGASALLRAAGAVLRPGDRRRARRPQVWAANSSAVQDRIAAAYGVTSTVVHPPVDVGRFAAGLGTATGDYHVLFGRLVPYKRVDLAIAAFAELGWPLLVAGDGRQREVLEAGAPPNVRFLGRVGDDELVELIAGARALVFPGEDDFGIVPVEAAAAGTPVVAYGRGGALDTVIDGETGVLFEEQTADALAAALRRAAATSWHRPAISAAAQRFGEPRFRAEMEALVATVV